MNKFEFFILNVLVFDFRNSVGHQPSVHGRPFQDVNR